MSNLLNSLRIYAGKWELLSSQALDAEDKAMFKSAKVVDSQYGLSVCFFLTRGGQSYIPISSNSKAVNVGDMVDLDKVEIETLGKDGESNILRVKVM